MRAFGDRTRKAFGKVGRMIWIQTAKKNGIKTPVLITAAVKDAASYEIMAVFWHFTKFIVKYMVDNCGMKRAEVFFLLKRYISNMEHQKEENE